MMAREVRIERRGARGLSDAEIQFLAGNIPEPTTEALDDYRRAPALAAAATAEQTLARVEQEVDTALAQVTEEVKPEGLSSKLFAGAEGLPEWRSIGSVADKIEDTFKSHQRFIRSGTTYIVGRTVTLDEATRNAGIRGGFGSLGNLQQADGANLSEILVIDPSTNYNAMRATDIDVAVFGNKLANTTPVTGIRLKNACVVSSSARLAALSCDRGILIEGNTEKMPIACHVARCGTGVQVDSTAASGSPDELDLRVYGQSNDIAFHATGLAKMSGSVFFALEGVNQVGAWLQTGWWNLQGEIREVGEGPDAIGLLIDNANVTASGELHIYGADEGGCAYAVDISSGQVGDLTIHTNHQVAGAMNKAARIRGAARGSMRLINNAAIGQTCIELGTADEALTGFAILPGTALSSADVCVNFIRASSCEVDLARCFGKIVFSALSFSNVVRLPHVHALTAVVENQGNESNKNVVILKGAYQLSELATLPYTPFIGLQVEYLREARGPALWDGFAWVAQRLPALPVSATTSLSLTPVLNDAVQFNRTAQGGPITINAPTSTTPLRDGQMLRIRLKDSGSARSITWNSIYRAIGVALPASTTAGKTMYAIAIFNGADARWDVVSVQIEA